jgi:hypothetical protein
MAPLARLYPRGPVDAGARLQALPDDGTVPGMPGWRCIHTPVTLSVTCRCGGRRTAPWWSAMHS